MADMADDDDLDDDDDDEDDDDESPGSAASLELYQIADGHAPHRRGQRIDAISMKSDCGVIGLRQRRLSVLNSAAAAQRDHKVRGLHTSRASRTSCYGGKEVWRL